MDLNQSILHQTTFSLNLANLSSSSLPSNTNFIFSPISILYALALLASGSKSQTLNQTLSIFRSDSLPDLISLFSQISKNIFLDGSPLGGPTLSSANGVWIDSSLSLRSGFVDALAFAFKAEIKSMDFQAKADEARQEVNSWVQNITNGLINNLLPSGSIDNRTKIILSNALYFKGAWDKKFDATQTKNSDFYLLDGTSIQTPFMTSKEEQFISAHNDFKVLRLPYKQGEDKRQFSMYIFLPESQNGISNLSEKLCSDSGFLTHHIPLHKIEVGEFRIPKFKISFGFEASSQLKAMGLDSPFGPSADLTEMVDLAAGSALFVSSIHHKSFVEVNEEGTEAAAATAVVIEMCSYNFMPMDFVADHPFIFVIREDVTGVVLFIGHMINPQSAI